MTHAELVARACRWLRTTRRCNLVLTEPRCYRVLECPDAIGWIRGNHSILVECKTSIEDFRADQRKSHRKESIGLGRERWYFCERNNIPFIVEDILQGGWGLLELHNDRVRRVIQADVRDDPRISELELSHVTAYACRCQFEQEALEAEARCGFST